MMEFILIAIFLGLVCALLSGNNTPNYRINVNCKKYIKDPGRILGSCGKKKGIFKSKVCDDVDLSGSCKMIEPYPRPEIKPVGQGIKK